MAETAELGETTTAAEPMEGVEEEKKGEEVKGKDQNNQKEEDEYEDDPDETDPEKAEDLRTNPRLYLLAGPILVKDLFTLRELRNVMNRCEHYEVRYFTRGDTPLDRTRKTKKGFIRFNFRTASMAYWVLDNLRNLQLIRLKNKSTLNCYMTSKTIALQTMHAMSDSLLEFKKHFEALAEQDISHRTLYFGNFPKTIDEEKFKEFVPEAQHIELPTFKDKPRGYAYVEFESKEKAEECLTTYKGKTLANMPIVVRKIGAGKSAQLLSTGEDNRKRLKMMRNGNQRGPSGRTKGPRRTNRPEWELWSNNSGRYAGGRGDFFSQPPYPMMRDFRDFRGPRGGRMDGWGGGPPPRRPPYGMNNRNRRNDGGFGDPWVSSSSLTQNY